MASAAMPSGMLTANKYGQVPTARMAAATVGPTAAETASETKASICAQKEAIEVAIDSAKMGIRSRSTGSSGRESWPSTWLWFDTSTHATCSGVVSV